VAKALLDLFPNIGLNRTKLIRALHGSHVSQENIGSNKTSTNAINTRGKSIASTQIQSHFYVQLNGAAQNGGENSLKDMHTNMDLMPLYQLIGILIPENK
jgi:hypothetical protein